jgi:hypothetical protein
MLRVILVYEVCITTIRKCGGSRVPTDRSGIFSPAEASNGKFLYQFTEYWDRVLECASGLAQASITH